MRIYLLIACFFSFFSTIGQTEEPKKSLCSCKEEFVETQHEMVIQEKTIRYKAVVGSLLLSDERCEPKANIFFTSYTKENPDPSQPRPISFCFNGGPGSSSVWLHLGCLGPKRIAFDAQGTPLCPPRLTDNDNSLLDISDLVFIDPVSTGFSRSTSVESTKSYHGVLEDVKSIAEFIRLYLSRFNRWDSPRFLVGESYGTIRASVLADYLHSQKYIDVNGLVLISSALQLQTLSFDPGNDLPFVVFLPTYATSAWYHKKLDPKWQSLSLAEIYRMAKDFATNEYATGLFKGSLISSKEKEAILDKFSQLTGLSKPYIENSNLRVTRANFSKELLRDQKKIIGYFDSRVLGIATNSIGESVEYDPSTDIVIGPFTTAWNHYLRTDLGWKEDNEYKILSNVFPWDFDSSNEYLFVGDNLRNVLTQQPKSKAFVACGYYDLATPLFSANYTMAHLGLDTSLQDHITIKSYEGGHMMFLVPSVLSELKKDLSAFYQTALCPLPQPKP